MNLDEAIQRHAEWKMKFRSAMANKEQLDADGIAKDNCCMLGKWLYSDGKAKFGSKPEFQKVLDMHKQFHCEAGKVAKLINDRKYTEAEAALAFGTMYSNASSAVGVAIVCLRKVAA